MGGSQELRGSYGTWFTRITIAREVGNGGRVGGVLWRTVEQASAGVYLGPGWVGDCGALGCSIVDRRDLNVDSGWGRKEIPKWRSYSGVE